jgi:hypothetical protein
MPMRKRSRRGTVSKAKHKSPYLLCSVCTGRSLCSRFVFHGRVVRPDCSEYLFGLLQDNKDLALSRELFSIFFRNTNSGKNE